MRIQQFIVNILSVLLLFVYSSCGENDNKKNNNINSNSVIENAAISIENSSDNQQNVNNLNDKNNTIQQNNNSLQNQNNHDNSNNFSDCVNGYTEQSGNCVLDNEQEEPDHNWSMASLQASPPWGAVTLTLTYNGDLPFNMRNADIVLESPISISAVWGGALEGVLSSPIFSVTSTENNLKYKVTITYGLGEEAWVDSKIEKDESIEIKFTPANEIDVNEIKLIDVQGQIFVSESTEGLRYLNDPVDLNVKGWGQCLQMGTVTGNSSSINQKLADSKVRVIFKYAGNGGNGDRGQILEAVVTQGTIEQARAVERLDSDSNRRVLPVMVVYTGEASGGGAAEDDILNGDNLFKHYVNLIRIAKKLQSAKDNDHKSPGSIILNPDLLGAWQQNETTQFNPNYLEADGSYKIFNVKNALLTAIEYINNNDDNTNAPNSIPNIISDNILGWIQSQNFVIRQYAPDITFGWQINLWAPGSALWIHQRYSGRQELWDLTSSKVSNFIEKLGVYSGNFVPDYITFDKYERDGFGSQARGVGYAFNNLDWENYLEFVKQITDYFKKPALLWQIPGGHMPVNSEDTGSYDINQHAASGGVYFMGDKLIGTDFQNQIKPELLNISLPETLYNLNVDNLTIKEYLGEDPEYDWGKQRLREAAYANVFAILWGGGSTTAVVPTASTGDDNGWLKERVVNYYNNGCMKIIKNENNQSDINETIISGNTRLDTILNSLESEMNSEVLLTENPDLTWSSSSIYKWNDFLSSLRIVHQAGISSYKFYMGKDSNEELGKKYALVNIAAFLAQSMKETIKYDVCDENNWSNDIGYPITSACGQLNQDYESYGEGDVISCPKNPKMETTARTHAKWYGAPGPLFTAPDSALIYAGAYSNGKVGGYWNYSSPASCNPDNADRISYETPAYARRECEVYEGQQAGGFVWDGSGNSVQGCGWWGRGVIQTTGRRNFGLLNHYLGRSHLDKTDSQLMLNYPIPQNPNYPDMDFCSNPEVICTTEKYPELKWISGLFYWITSVQEYNENGWNYMEKLKEYVNSNMQGDSFINSVSGIVNRGCHNPPCGTGSLDGGPERKDNFIKVLEKFGLN